LGVITLKPDATSMLSLFCVLLVVVQPTVNANRAMTLIVLNEFRICFMILGSLKIALFLICYLRPLASTHATDSPLDPSKLMPSNSHSCWRAPCRTVGLWSYYTFCPYNPQDRENRWLVLATKSPRGGSRERSEMQQQRFCLARKAQHSAIALGQRPRIRGAPKQRQR
jgi:hypothetical protein